MPSAGNKGSPPGSCASAIRSEVITTIAPQLIQKQLLIANAIFLSACIAFMSGGSLLFALRDNALRIVHCLSEKNITAIEGSMNRPHDMFVKMRLQNVIPNDGSELPAMFVVVPGSKCSPFR